jgi:FSR family fosmidomycin resistance protein-like MFS transporter
MKSFSSQPNRAVRHLTALVLILLTIEFLDELVFGLEQAAWPLIRDELRLTYTQIGLLFTMPSLLGAITEPFIGVLGDTGWRRSISLTGGVGFAVACALTSQAFSFEILLVSFSMFFLSSGAFVSLSQATLMDTDPERHEALMVRWTAAGSLGVVLGPLVLAGLAWLGWSWRAGFMLFAALAVALTVLAARFPFPKVSSTENVSLASGLRAALQAFRRPVVLRWLILLEFADFMLDILLSFLALYVVDVAGGTVEQGALAVAVWTGVGLLGDILLIPLLEKVRGLSYLRVSAVMVFGLFTAFLLVPSFPFKLGLLALMGLFNAGWYAILKGQLYSALPGQSGTVMAVDALFGLGASFVPVLLGWVADEFSLTATMWLLLLGPVVLWVGIPRQSPMDADERG